MGQRKANGLSRRASNIAGTPVPSSTQRYAAEGISQPLRIQRRCPAASLLPSRASDWQWENQSDSWNLRLAVHHDMGSWLLQFGLFWKPRLEMEIQMWVQELRGLSSRSRGIERSILGQLRLYQVFQILWHRNAAALLWSSWGTFPAPQFAVEAAFVPRENVTRPSYHSSLLNSFTSSIMNYLYARHATDASGQLNLTIYLFASLETCMRLTETKTRS
jgi:hypothetical protein